MKSNKKLWTVLLSAIAIVALVLVVVKLKTLATATCDGTIKVSIVNLEGTTINEKTIEFNNGDDLVELLTNNFENVYVDNGFLYTIDKLTTPEDWSTFICLYVDGEMSMVGITEVVYTDGTEISFVDTVMSY